MRALHHRVRGESLLARAASALDLAKRQEQRGRGRPASRACPPRLRAQPVKMPHAVFFGRKRIKKLRQGFDLAHGIPRSFEPLGAL